MTGKSIILFDGVCNLCNRAVLFIIDRDPGRRFQFAPLQSDFAIDLLASLNQEVSEAGADSIVLIQDGCVYQRSEATLRIAKRLSGPWPLLSLFLIIPRASRDRAYDLVARNRYRWFGREESCRVPTPESQQRFLA